MLYLQLFFVFIKVGLLGFGGGMALISLIQGEVLSRGWMTQTEFVDIVAISQVTPGPIGMNCATYVGYTVGGIWGSLLASAAIVLPSLVIMLSVCYAYDYIKDKHQNNRVFQIVMRVIRFLVVLLVAHAAIVLITPTTFIDYRSWIIFGIVFVASVVPIFAPKEQRWAQRLDHPIGLIILSAFAGWLLYA